MIIELSPQGGLELINRSDLATESEKTYITFLGTTIRGYDGQPVQEYLMVML